MNDDRQSTAEAPAGFESCCSTYCTNIVHTGYISTWVGLWYVWHIPLDMAKTYAATLHAISVTYIPESYHVRQEDVLEQPGQMSDMDNAKNWFERFNENAKENNVQL